MLRFRECSLDKATNGLFSKDLLNGYIRLPLGEKWNESQYRQWFKKFNFEGIFFKVKSGKDTQIMGLKEFDFRWEKIGHNCMLLEMTLTRMRRYQRVINL